MYIVDLIAHAFAVKKKRQLTVRQLDPTLLVQSKLPRTSARF